MIPGLTGGQLQNAREESREVGLETQAKRRQQI